MIDRSYLPYKSAREYQDRAMAKWMGFFISEHSTELSRSGDSVQFCKGMNDDEKMILLGQLFFGKQKILLYTKIRKEPYIGVIHDITAEKIYLKTKSEMPNFSFSQILSITLIEVIESE